MSSRGMLLLAIPYGHVCSLQYELSQQLQPAINGSSWAMVISKAIRILTMGHVWAVTIPTHFLSTLSFLNPTTPHAATLRGHSCASRF